MIAPTLRTLVLALAAGLLLAVPASADRTADLIFEDPTIAPGDAADAPQVIATWRRLGADWVRVQAFWDAVSPDKESQTRPPGFDVANPNDPRYDWTRLDNAINRVRANGMRVMLTIHQFNPVWASSEPNRGQLGWKPSPVLYGQWARALALRYRGRVDRYALGNEPNQKVFMQPQTECRRVGRRRLCERTAANIYRELVRAAFPAIKAVDNKPVIMGELAPIGAIGNNAGNLAPLAFIRAMGCLDDRYRRIRVGACARFKAARADAFGYHPYQVRERPTQPQRNPNLAKLGDFKRLFGVLDRLTRARRIIAPRRKFNVYVTEYGYETNPPDRKNGVSLGQQNRYLQEAAFIVWSTPRVKQFSQYLWRDDGFDPTTGQVMGFQTGLNFNARFNDGAPKPSLATFPHPIFLVQRKGRRPAMLWGQVRPGTTHTVQVLRALRGQGFAPWVSVQTDRLGYFTRRGLTRGARYQFRYTFGGQAFTSDATPAVR